MQNNYLTELSDSTSIEHIITDSLYELFGVKNQVYIASFTFNSSWPIPKFTFNLAQEISKKIDEVGIKLGKEKFKDFKSHKTRFLPEMVNEVWLETSQFISKKTSEMIENKDTEQKFRTDLKEAIQKGAIRPSIPSDQVTTEGISAIREKLLKKVETIGIEDLLFKFKDNLYKYFQKEFDLYKEPKKEINNQFKIK